jgi:hypothetical protein
MFKFEFTCRTSFLYVTASRVGSNVCARKESKTETIILVSNTSLRHMKNTLMMLVVVDCDQLGSDLGIPGMAKTCTILSEKFSARNAHESKECGGGRGVQLAVSTC